jgi:biotin carboxylase
MSRSGELKLALHKRFQRYFCKQAFALYRESIPPQPYTKLSGRFLSDMGWWGGAVVEMRIDSRDNTAKLMEINPRFGSGILEITETGINAPLMCLKIARRQEVEAVENYPIAVYVHPVDDALVFGLWFLNLIVYRLVTFWRGKTRCDPVGTPTSWNKLIQPYKYAYFSGKKVMLDPKIKLFFQEPLVSIILWLQRFASVLRAAGDLGQALQQEVFSVRQRPVKADRPLETHK